MAKETKRNTREPKDDALVDSVKRIGVGLLWAGTDLGQNDIAQVMGMGDKRVNNMLKGIEKPGKKNKHKEIKKK